MHSRHLAAGFKKFQLCA